MKQLRRVFFGSITVAVGLFGHLQIASGVSLASSMPQSPVIEQVDFVPITAEHTVVDNTYSDPCVAQTAQEQACVRLYTEAKVDGDGYDECVQRTLATKYLCLNQPNLSAALYR